MAYILDPTNTADDDGYAGVNELAALTVTKEVLDKNPLFRQAERFILGFVPDADIRATGRGTGRTYPDRDEIISALQFIAASFIIQGAEKVGDATVTQGTGEVKSRTQTIDGVTHTESYDVGSSVSRSGGNEIGAADRADFLYEQGLEILRALGIDVTDADTGLLGDVSLTDSKLGVEYINPNPYIR